MKDERKQELAREAVSRFVVETKGESFTGSNDGRAREDGTHAGDLMQLTREAAEEVVRGAIATAVREATEPHCKRCGLRIG